MDTENKELEQQNIENTPEESIPEVPTEEVTPTAEESPESAQDTEGETTESGKLIEDPDDPVNEMTSEKIAGFLKQAEQMVLIMQSQWEASARELHITDSHMRQLGKWNDDHKTPVPENLTQEEKDKWDYLNGLDSLTDEAIEEIFGAEHPIYGIDHAHTMDRIKGAANDFFQWLSVMREYRNIHDAYLQLLELEEQKNVEELRARAEAEEDPEKKEKMLVSVAMYYNRKYLEFLAEPLTDAARNRILKALYDENKVTYWINRCVDKLRQLKISSKFILEISQFEKRILPEKYHKCSNVLLLYFTNVCIYECDAHDKKSDGRTKTVCMVMALDGVIRNTTSEENRNRVLANIMAFEDQFLPYINETPNAPEADTVEGKEQTS